MLENKDTRFSSERWVAIEKLNPEFTAFFPGNISIMIFLSQKKVSNENEFREVLWRIT